MSCQVCKRDRVKVVARGLCGACYQRWSKTGTTEYQRWGKSSRCQIDDCDGRATSYGLCEKHRQRVRSHGHTGLKRDSWGAASNHPLKHSWSWMRRHRGRHNIDAAWENDFLQFALDVGERPSPKHKLYAADESKPIGPSNFIWKRSITERAYGEDQKTYNSRIQRVYRAVRKEAFHGYDLKKHYGLTREQFVAMHEAQSGLCAICKRPEDRRDGRGNLRNLAVDHCHRTGAVRDLLCSSCNSAIGHFRDDISLIKTAIAYLEKHSTD